MSGLQDKACQSRLNKRLTGLHPDSYYCLRKSIRYVPFRLSFAGGERSMRWWLMVGLGLFLLAPLQGQENTAPEAKEQELQQLRERVAALERLVQLLQAELAALKRNGVPLTSSSPQTHLASAPQSPSDEEKRQLEQELHGNWLKPHQHNNPLSALRLPMARLSLEEGCGKR